MMLALVLSGLGWGGTHRRPYISPGHRIPPPDIHEVLVTQGVPGKCDMADIRDPKGHEVITNDLDFGRG